MVCLPKYIFNSSIEYKLALLFSLCKLLCYERTKIMQSALSQALCALEELRLLTQRESASSLVSAGGAH